MTDSEIIGSWRRAQDKRAQVKILADLNAVTAQEMQAKLEELQLWPEKKPARELTERERKVEELVGEGLDDVDIAERLGLSVWTAGDTRRKLGLKKPRGQRSPKVEQVPVDKLVPAEPEQPEPDPEIVTRVMTRKDILAAAERCVCGEREQDYGSPEDNFTVIADLWADYLRGCGVPLDSLRPNDVAAMLALLKIARIATGHGKADNWIDLAGYAACGGEVEGME